MAGGKTHPNAPWLPFAGRSQRAPLMFLRVCSGCRWTSRCVCLWRDEPVRWAAHGGFPSAPSVAACQCGGEVSVRVLHCLPCLSLSMWWQSLSAGPSFRPMYFITMSLLSNIRALPSISCRQSFTWLTLSPPNTEFSVIMRRLLRPNSHTIRPK